MKKGVYFSFKLKNLAVFSFTFLFTASVIFSFYFFKYKKPAEIITSPVSGNAVLSKTIIIDPGHGGEDGGTASVKGKLEKEVNLEISEKLDDLMTLLGFQTVMTRSDDSLIYNEGSESIRSKKVSDIKNRLKIMNEYPEGIFLSVHQNYFTESSSKGTQVFYSGNRPESEILAEKIQLSVKSDLQRENYRKTKKSGKEIYLLYHAESVAVMVECGFLSNPTEALELQSSDYQSKMAFSITKGICDYLKM